MPLVARRLIPVEDVDRPALAAHRLAEGGDGGEGGQVELALTRTQQRAILAAAAAQLALQVAMLRDLRRRSPDELRGSKRWWTVAAFVNVVGPTAYFAAGRRGRRPTR